MERKFQIKISQHTPRWQIPEKLLPVVNLFIILCVRNCVCVLLYCVCARNCVCVCACVCWLSSPHCNSQLAGKMDSPCYRFLADKSPYNHLISYYQQPQTLKLIFIGVKKRNPPWHHRPLWSSPFIGNFFFP